MISLIISFLKLPHELTQITSFDRKERTVLWTSVEMEFHESGLILKFPIPVINTIW